MFKLEIRIKEENKTKTSAEYYWVKSKPEEETKIIQFFFERLKKDEELFINGKRYKN